MALPFASDGPREDCSGSKCSIRSLLPDGLQEATEQVPHLMQYLHLVPIKDVGVPEYYENINRSHADLPRRNLIYRVASEIFVHIYPDLEDARDYYIAIEP